MRINYLVKLVFIVLLAVMYGCTTRTVQFQTGSLNEAKAYYSLPRLPPRLPHITKMNGADSSQWRVLGIANCGKPHKQIRISEDQRAEHQESRISGKGRSELINA